MGVTGMVNERGGAGGRGLKGKGSLRRVVEKGNEESVSGDRLEDACR